MGSAQQWDLQGAGHTVSTARRQRDDVHAQLTFTFLFPPELQPRVENCAAGGKVGRLPQAT